MNRLIALLSIVPLDTEKVSRIAPQYIAKAILLPSGEIAADGKVYHKGANVHLEIYTDKKDPELEQRVEDVLDAHEIFYNKSETWIGSERLYEVLYIFGWEA